MHRIQECSQQCSKQQIIYWRSFQHGFFFKEMVIPKIQRRTTTLHIRKSEENRIIQWKRKKILKKGNRFFDCLKLSINGSSKLFDEKKSNAWEIHKLVKIEICLRNQKTWKKSSSTWREGKVPVCNRIEKVAAIEVCVFFRCMYLSLKQREVCATSPSEIWRRSNTKETQKKHSLVFFFCSAKHIANFGNMVSYFFISQSMTNV